MTIHMVLGTRGECYLSRDGTGMAPRKLNPVVYAQWQAGGGNKAFGVIKIPGWGKDSRAEAILPIDRGTVTQDRQEIPCVYSGCPGGFIYFCALWGPQIWGLGRAKGQRS